MSAIRPLICHTIRRTTAMRSVVCTARLVPIVQVRTMASDATTAT
jgi:hypothetical protein